MITRSLRLTAPSFWTWVMIAACVMLAVLLFLPILSVFVISFEDAETGRFTLENYVEIFTRRYYVSALSNTLIVGFAGMIGACLLGVPLAFCMSRFQLRGRTLISTMAVLALVSPPFIGAYAWIMLLGNNGAITNALEAIGIDMPSIYGMSGIILVFSLKFFPFIYLMTENALNGINKSLEDAAENLGCSAWRRFRKVTFPLVFPAVSTGAIISFVLSIADFGTPAIIGRGVRTLSTIAYTQYTSEMGGTPTMAVTISMVMIAISMLALLIQRRMLAKRRYASSMTHKCRRAPLRGWWQSVLVHVMSYSIALAGMIPSFVVIWTSFLATNGPVFSGGFGLDSYRRIMAEAPEAVKNSFIFALCAVALIAVVSSLLSFIVVRRESFTSGLLDLILMVPYLVPGVVMAIGFVTTFSSGWYNLVGTATMIVLIVFIRRLPYGVRSTSSVLRQVKPSIEEAAIALGASPAKTFAKITVPLIMPGIIVGSLMSFITAINELSSTLIVYTSSTVTMPVKIYLSVVDGEFGVAAALSTVLTISTGLCVFLVFRLSEDRETNFV
ncbi:ABC transporter permease [Celeribacter halophilus]|uniref:ABC transporter permease n=1 Tax=Celeribacter halophilus TaxID=576117 RepID=UPI0020914F88|nr:iron ABC transporter permease [Celeribacter halophilus]MDO6511859.1 iron ABC transporter permease [Celeribacter halophilus]